ncbi:hypothetical protein LV779_38590 [Streptomyces thinghirensis]|nr:hypothetical protein [Streptomyces thinghirensis]
MAASAYATPAATGVNNGSRTPGLEPDGQNPGQADAARVVSSSGAERPSGGRRSAW